MIITDEREIRGALHAPGPEAILHRTERELASVLLAGEALLLARGEDVTVGDERRRRVVARPEASRIPFHPAAIPKDPHALLSPPPKID